MRFPFFRNRDSVKNGILISIRRTGDGFHPGLFNWIHRKEVEFVSGKNKLKGYIFWNAKDNKLSEKIIVLVHGYGVTHKDYEIEIEEFVKRKYSVFTYDMTGCGMSQGKKIGGFS